MITRVPRPKAPPRVRHSRWGRLDVGIGIERRHFAKAAVHGDLELGCASAAKARNSVLFDDAARSARDGQDTDEADWVGHGVSRSGARRRLAP
jgi:hypothetical protein